MASAPAIDRSPTAVLLGHEYDQRFHLRADSRPSRIRAMLGSIELAGDQATVPAENGLGFGDKGHLREELPPKPFADFRQRAPFRVGEPDFAGQVCAENSVLCDEVFALEEKALIHETCHVRQQPRPIIVLHAEAT